MLVPLPTIDYLFQSIDWLPVFPQQSNRSEYTSRQQTIATPGAEMWTAEAITIPATTAAELRAWRAFVIACRGSENSFRLPALPLRQYAGAEPTVTAAVAGNRAVTVSSAANVQIGMCATVHQADGHDRLVVVVGIDGANVHFEPYLTAAPTIASTFVIGDPYAVVKFADPRQPLPTMRAALRLQVEEKL